MCNEMVLHQIVSLYVWTNLQSFSKYYITEDIVVYWVEVPLKKA